MTELERAVLAGVLPADRDRMFYLKERLTDDHFTGAYRDIWKLLIRIADITGGEVATRATLDTALNRVPDLPIDRRAAIDDSLDNLFSMGELPESEFKASVAFLEEDYRVNKLGEGLTQAMTILTKGVDNGKETIQGVESAIESVYSTVTEVEQSTGEAMPEGDVYEEKEELLRELTEQDSIDRLATHIRPLDDLTFGGIGAGELWLIGAYTGVGKTFLCINMAYTLSQFSGANVVYLTAETLRSQVRRRLLVRHTHHPKFGLPNGLSVSALKSHTADNKVLTPEQEQQWAEVIQDFTNPDPDRGRLYVAQIPMDAKVSTMHAKLNQLQTQFNVDVVIVDSLDLLASESRRGTNREELNEVLRSAKHLATTFNNGQGTRLISPWQTSVAAWREAQERGRYTKDSLGETIEATRKSDLVLTLLEKPNDQFTLKAQPIKFRDASPQDFELDIDYDRGFAGSTERIGSAYEQDMFDASTLSEFS